MITNHRFRDVVCSDQDPNFSVPSLLLLPLGRVREEAVSVVYQAMHEYELESALVKMSKDLRAIYFEVLDTSLPVCCAPNWNDGSNRGSPCINCCYCKHCLGFWAACKSTNDVPLSVFRAVSGGVL